MKIIGRETERDILRRCLESKRSEFVAVYGRRRVGKTYLIRETLGSEFAFSASGVLSEEGGMAVQLESFNDEIVDAGGAGLARA
jgi:AAA+ ATPase superfamily predicted ATPase